MNNRRISPHSRRKMSRVNVISALARIEREVVVICLRAPVMPENADVECAFDSLRTQIMSLFPSKVKS